MAQRTWQDNAKEFGALSKQGMDFRLALLAAASITMADHADPTDDKTTVSTFAQVAGTTPARIVRHLSAYHKLAEQRVVPVASRLLPQSVMNFEVSTEVINRFEAEFDASKAGSRPRSPVSEISGALASKPGYADKLINGLDSEALRELSRSLMQRTQDDRRNAKTEEELAEADARMRGYTEESKLVEEQEIQETGHLHVFSAMSGARSHLRHALTLLGKLNDEALTTEVRERIDSEIQLLSDQLALITRRMDTGRDADWDEALAQLIND